MAEKRNSASSIPKKYNNKLEQPLTMAQGGNRESQNEITNKSLQGVELENNKYSKMLLLHKA
jgi:hypothetical protein